MAALRNNETLTLQNINTKFQQGKKMQIIENLFELSIFTKQILKNLKAHLYDSMIWLKLI